MERSFEERWKKKSFEESWEEWDKRRHKITSGREMAAATFFFQLGKEKGKIEAYDEIHPIYIEYWRGPKIEYQRGVLERFERALESIAPWITPKPKDEI